MKVKILMVNNNQIENLIISPKLWRNLHESYKIKKGIVVKNEYYFKKEFKDFLDLNKLKSTIFNLNCLEELNGIILTKTQIKKRF